MRCYAAILILLLLISSCDKPKSFGKEDHFLSEGILISNEGNFQWGNASVSFYDEEKDTLLQDVFQSVNQRPLGDVLQSIYLDDKHAYLVVNNSGKIEVVDKHSFDLQYTISGFMSPRYFQIVGPDKAYVSDLYADKIAVVDLNSNEIISHISCEGWTEEMVQIDDLVYVANLDSNLIHVIDAKNDFIVRDYTIPFDLNSLKIDSHNRLWVSGAHDQMGYVSIIDPLTMNVLNTYSVDSETPTNLWVSQDSKSAYFLSNGLWYIDLTIENSNPRLVIPSDGNLFYGFSVFSDKIYLADAVNYVQKGRVLVYDLSYSLVDEWEVGIIPSEFDLIQP